MHRKSAYILFLAVLGMLVIGMAMLTSSSDARRFGSESGWPSARSPRLSITIFGSGHGGFGLVSHSLRWRFASFRISECALTVRAGGLASVSSVFNLLRSRRSLPCFLSPLVFRVVKRQT